jgi:hypothetical protein
MYAAMLARSIEHDQARLASKEEITAFLDHAFQEIGVKPDRETMHLARMGVGALLAENDFIEELLRFRLSNPNASLPIGTRERMVEAIKRTVDGFVRGQ